MNEFELPLHLLDDPAMLQIEQLLNVPLPGEESGTNENTPQRGEQQAHESCGESHFENTFWNPNCNSENFGSEQIPIEETWRFNQCDDENFFQFTKLGMDDLFLSEAILIIGEVKTLIFCKEKKILQYNHKHSECCINAKLFVYPNSDQGIIFQAKLELVKVKNKKIVPIISDKNNNNGKALWIHNSETDIINVVGNKAEFKFVISETSKNHQKLNHGNCPCDPATKDFYLLLTIFYGPFEQKFLSNPFTVISKDVKRKREIQDTAKVTTLDRLRLEVGLCFHSCSVIQDRKVVLVGGYHKAHGGLFGKCTSPPEKHFSETIFVTDFKLKESEWIQREMNFPEGGIASHSAVVVSDCILIFGGETKRGVTNQLWLLRMDGRDFPLKWQQLNFQDPPSPRLGHTAVCRKKDAFTWDMIVFGGQFESLKQNEKITYNDLYILNFTYHGGDISYGVWQKVEFGTTVPKQRMYHSAVLSTEGDMFIFGGSRRKTLSDTQRKTKFMNDIWKYIPSKKEWHRVNSGGDKPSKRDGHFMFYHGSSIYICGGWISGMNLAHEASKKREKLEEGIRLLQNTDERDHYAKDLWRYDLEECSWKEVSNNLGIVFSHCGFAMFEGNSTTLQVYTFGGEKISADSNVYQISICLPDKRSKSKSKKKKTN